MEASLSFNHVAENHHTEPVVRSPTPDPYVVPVIEVPEGGRSLILTPISKKALPDYDEQKSRYLRGEQIMWDDSKTNRARPGDLLGFYHRKNQIEIHLIIGTDKPTNRLPSWSDNVGQSDRNVVYLSSEPIVVIPWSVWLELGGTSTLQGTFQARQGKDNILKYINE